MDTDKEKQSLDLKIFALNTVCSIRLLNLTPYPIGVDEHSKYQLKLHLTLPSYTIGNYYTPSSEAKISPKTSKDFTIVKASNPRFDNL